MCLCKCVRLFETLHCSRHHITKSVRATVFLARVSNVVVFAEVWDTVLLPPAFGGCVRSPQMFEVPHCLKELLWRLYWQRRLSSQMFGPPQEKHLLLMRLCSHILPPRHCKYLCFSVNCIHTMLLFYCHFRKENLVWSTLIGRNKSDYWKIRYIGARKIRYIGGYVYKYRWHETVNWLGWGGRRSAHCRRCG